MTVESEQPAVEETPPPAGPVKEPHIDLSKVPEDVRDQVKRRFGWFTRQLGEQDRQISETTAHLQRLEAALAEKEAKAAERDRASTKSVLKTEKINALNKGDYVKAEEADDKLRKLEVEAVKPKPAANGAGKLSDSDIAAVNEWQGERDDSGAYVRPWALPGHKLFKQATSVIQQIHEQNPRWGTPRVLEAAHEYIVGQLSAASAKTPVVATDSTPSATNSKSNLSQEQRMVAHRMYPQMKEAEAETRYGQSLKKYGKTDK